MSSQDALWRIPETLGWWWYGSISIMAGAAALIMIFKMILRHPFDALLVARCMIVGGLVCFAYRSANSGLSEIGIGFTVTGSLFTSVLVATNWCSRENQTEMLVPYLWRRALTWLCGPRKLWFHPEDVGKRDL